MADEARENNGQRDEDINDAFDKIAFAEEKFADDGFKEGLLKGQNEGRIEGYHLGYHRGVILGNEIGFYKGLVKSLMENLDSIEPQKQEKIIKLLRKLNILLEDFPRNNCESVDFSASISDIRSYYRKLISLLKFKKTYSVVSDISF